MAYVQRDSSGNIIGIYANAQDHATEWVDNPVLYVAPQPISVTPYQFKAALVQQGLYTQVLNAVNASPQLTQLAWSEAQTFVENDPLIVNLAASLNLTAQVHPLFQLAETLSP